MLGHLDLQRGQVEGLPPLHPGDRPACQRPPAAGAAARFVRHLMVWVGHLPQRPAPMAILPARLPASFLAQRPRLRRRLVQPLRTRGLRRVAGVLSRLRLQLGDPLRGLRQRDAQLFRPGLRGHQLSPKAHHQGGKHLVGGSRLIVGHARTLRTQDQPAQASKINTARPTRSRANHPPTT